MQQFYEDHQHLFFDVITSPLVCISKTGVELTASDRYLVSQEENIDVPTFLGVKNGDKHKGPFIVPHQDACELAKNLFKSISGKTTKNVIFFDHSPTMNWAMFLVGGNIKLVDIKTEQPTLFEKENKKSHLRNLELIIGVQNGYDGDDEITFYTTIRHKEYEKGSFLTIGSYKFPMEVKKDYTAYWRIKGESLQAKEVITEPLLNLIKGKASNNFKSEIHDFKDLYRRLEKESWENIAEHFTPVCLDILNINRSIESIKNDSKLKREINSAIGNSSSFLSLGINKGRKDFAMLLDFILYNNHFDIVDYYYKREKTEAIFTQKRPYKIINSRLLNALNNSEGLKKYVDEQKETFEKIKKILAEST